MDYNTLRVADVTTPKFIKIVSAAGKQLLTLDISGDGLTAEFDPEDLDAAAAQFVEALTSLKVSKE